MFETSLVVNALAAMRDAVFRIGFNPAETVLTVRLIFRPDATVVQFELAGTEVPEGTPDGTMPEPLIWEDPFADFVTGTDASQFDLRVPDGLVENLRFRLPDGVQNAGRPLWLKLVRPYGMLGTVPWERELHADLQRPVLRLPESPHRAGERSDVLENAIVVDPGPSVEPDAMMHRINELVRAIFGGSNRAITRVHVFGRADWFARLQELAGDPRVTVHDPEGAQTSFQVATGIGDSGPVLRSAAWADWIADSLRGRGLDALHLLCRTHDAENGAALLLSCSPSPAEEAIEISPGHKTVAFAAIDPEELELLLDRSGAWAVSFVPTDIGRTRQMAFIADAFAHRRAGAVLFDPLLGSTEDGSLLAALKLLFGNSRIAPVLTEGFVYCHPALLGAEVTAPDSDLVALLAEHGLLLAQRAPLTQRLLSSLTRIIPGVATLEPATAPNWVGSVQRFLEAAALDEARRSAQDVQLVSPSAVLQTTADTAAAEDEPAASPSSSPETKAVLADIQGVVADYLKHHGGV